MVREPNFSDDWQAGSLRTNRVEQHCGAFPLAGPMMVEREADGDQTSQACGIEQERLGLDTCRKAAMLGDVALAGRRLDFEPRRRKIEALCRKKVLVLQTWEKC